jgi:Arc/MetJ family transcription regulator
MAVSWRLVQRTIHDTTLVLDDELVAKAQALTGIENRPTLVPEALEALIERESARWLARLGAAEPNVKDAPRRRLTLE